MKGVGQRTDEIFQQNLRAVHVATDQIFFWLLLAQWALAVALALLVSPDAWRGTSRSLHLHVAIAVVLGGVVNAPPLALLHLRPGWWLTRQSVAVAQIMWSGLLIHITGGRIETHFHIFGSLAFLAFYRDWRLLTTATAIVAADHLARGSFLPESVYGIQNPEWWRFLEHAAWVAFEDVVLLLGCRRSITEMKALADRESSLRGVTLDVTRQKKLESELLRAQKLESVGRLAAGVAHEINTPVQFVGDSIHFVRDAAGDMMTVIEKLQAVQRSVLDGAPSMDAATRAAEAEEAADLPYLIEQVPRALDRSLEGLSRVATIVRSMKEFAHPGAREMLPVDLNHAIQATLKIAVNEYRYVADLETDLGELPPVVCHVGEVNQVILDIVVNAARAISDVVQNSGRRGLISVRTAREGDNVVIAISDTGGGIPDAIRDRIFDPFFTTREVGKGTGQGLALARTAIVEGHHGELSVETEIGKGTTFFIRLPMDGAAATWKDLAA